MKFHLVSGGCGFVGRNMVKRLYQTTNDTIIFIDNLLMGHHPSTWLDPEKVGNNADAEVYGVDERLLFIQDDFRNFLSAIITNPQHIQEKYNLDFYKFSDVFHFAANVGGRATIDGDPMKVALDLSIDAEFFFWVSRHKPARVLYPSSSAAYPISMQTKSNATALSESDIDFKNIGQPDMTYGWSKLTGEYLAQICAKHYGVSVTCIRPFSGYGEDQDLTYPIPAIAARIARQENPIVIWGTGKQSRDFVHIEDILDCIFVGMNKVTDGTSINIGQGKLTTLIEIVDILSKFADYNPAIKPQLDNPVGVFSQYGNMDYVKNTLGWEAKIPLEDGLKRIYEAALQRERAAEVV